MALNMILTITRIAKSLHEYIAELENELQSDTSFNSTQDQLIAAARRAKQEIAEEKLNQWIYIGYEICNIRIKICSHYHTHNTI